MEAAPEGQPPGMPEGDWPGHGRRGLPSTEEFLRRYPSEISVDRPSVR